MTTTISFHYATLYKTGEKIQLYVVPVAAKFHRKIEKARCYNSGKFFSRQRIKFFEIKGITIKYIILRNPHQNGKTERYNYTDLDKTRCMIHEMIIDKKFWSKPFKNYLINTTLTSVLSKQKISTDI